MFTGLIAHLGVLERLHYIQEIALLAIRSESLAGDLRLGESVAVNGICLTVTRIDGPRFQAEATGETLSVTTLGEWTSGRVLHLERSLRVGDRLDGHWVSGHVDGVAIVRDVRPEGKARRVTFETAPELLVQLAAKGSVALDGVSLTIAAVGKTKTFEVVLIPHTRSVTTFARLRPGIQTNLEIDLLSRYAAREVAPTIPGNLTWDKLRQAGF